MRSHPSCRTSSSHAPASGPSWALALVEAALGPWHPDVSRVLDNLGNAHEMLGDYAAASACTSER